MTNPADLALAGWLASEETTRQANMILAQRYYDGDHQVPLTTRQKAYLGLQDNGRFAINYAGMVVNACAERLIVKTFDAPAGLAATLWRWWQQNNLDDLQQRVHAGALTLGEYFVLVDWDPAAGRPRYTPHKPYTDPTAGGDGYGCKAHYPDDDSDQAMTYGSKRWTETYTDSRGQTRHRQRLTLYYPGRVEKYELVGASHASPEAGWAPLRDPADTAWPLAWPGLIPVVHFRNPHLRSELWDAIPIQDAVNKVTLDSLAAADASGFRILFAKGFYPTTDGLPPAADGANYMRIHPGMWLGSPDPNTDLVPIEGSDLTGLLELKNNLILDLARTTATPVSRFTTRKGVEGEGTLREQERPLLDKIRRRQAVFGSSWEQCHYVARRLANTYGGQEQELDEEALVETLWEPAETRDEVEAIAAIALKREKLGIPREQAWIEAGYSADQIAAMKNMAP